MGAAIGEILPFAVALAAGPLPIIALVLILVSDGARAKGVAFVTGRLVGLSALVGATLVVFTFIDDPALGRRGDPSPTVSVVRVVIGVVLVALAVRLWLRRTSPSASRPSPLVRRVDRLTVRGSVRMGVVVSLIDPASLSLGLLAGLDIATARLPVPSAVLVAVAFVLVSTVTLTAPLIAYLVGGAASRERLLGVKAWLLANENTVMMVLFLIMGALLIGRGIRDLAG